MKIIYTRHARARMFERQIKTDVVESVVETGTTIETYPDDKPFPSMLLLGWPEGQALHVHVAEDATSQTRVIVTV